MKTVNKVGEVILTIGYLAVVGWAIWVFLLRISFNIYWLIIGVLLSVVGFYMNKFHNKD